jgi:hypothetical protein
VAAWVELRGARHSGTLNQMEERRDAELVKVLEEVDQLTAYAPPRVTTLRRVLLARHKYMLLAEGCDDGVVRQCKDGHGRRAQAGTAMRWLLSFPSRVGW